MSLPVDLNEVAELDMSPGLGDDSGLGEDLGEDLGDDMGAVRPVNTWNVFLPIGAVNASIAAGATVTFTVQPTEDFMAVRGIIQGSALDGLTVLSIKSGSDDQLKGSGALPARMFDAANALFFKLRPFPAAVPVTVQVQNNSAAAITNVSIGFMGRVTKRR